MNNRVVLFIPAIEVHRKYTLDGIVKSLILLSP